ncbi:MAG: diguanylate cyclase [Mariprofundales bacterium]
MSQNREIVDTSHAIEIGHRVWWVGSHFDDDPFPRHSYLIEHGDQSVLIDPGSSRTIATTRKKIEEVIHFDHIRYFICHHQDPDISASLLQLDQMITRDEAFIVSHWRTHHHNLTTPIWNIEDHDWSLDLGGRRINFILTPYLHTPAAFRTFDCGQGILFSGDIFGGAADNATLFARDEACLESIKTFHEQSMPSRDILQHTMLKLEKLPITMIAPLHGFIIPSPLVALIVSQLKSLECGLFMHGNQGNSVRELQELNGALTELPDALAHSHEFPELAERCLSMLSQELPMRSIEFRILEHTDTQCVCSLENRYKWMTKPINKQDRELFLQVEKLPFGSQGCQQAELQPDGTPAFLIPLRVRNSQHKQALAILKLKRDSKRTFSVLEAIETIAEPLAAALERERLRARIALERHAMYERSIHDPLTGLYSHHYMQDAAARMIHIHNRNPSASIGLIMLDIDHFNKMNDAHGHLTGDKALRNSGKVIRETLRDTDVPVLFGGKAFVLLVSSIDVHNLKQLTERIRRNIHQQQIQLDGGATLQITISAGIALHKQDETLDKLIERAEGALKEAKEQGHDRACFAHEITPYI